VILSTYCTNAFVVHRAFTLTKAAFSEDAMLKMTPSETLTEVTEERRGPIQMNISYGCLRGEREEILSPSRYRGGHRRHRQPSPVCGGCGSAGRTGGMCLAHLQVRRAGPAPAFLAQYGQSTNKKLFSKTGRVRPRPDASCSIIVRNALALLADKNVALAGTSCPN